MKLNLTKFLKPLNVFEAHGSFCCERMYEAFCRGFTASASYYAQSINEANTIVLWGSFSKKLLKALYEPITLGSKKYVLHIQGCKLRVDNQLTFSSLKPLAVNRIVSTCELTKEEIETLTNEARQCLRA